MQHLVHDTFQQIGEDPSCSTECARHGGCQGGRVQWESRWKRSQVMLYVAANKCDMRLQESSWQHRIQSVDTASIKLAADKCTLRVAVAKVQKWSSVSALLCGETRSSQNARILRKHSLHFSDQQSCGWCLKLLIVKSMRPLEVTSSQI